ncbi:hypothetical protein DCAR_0101191 [Daucus carota subsp. sativus]|uniref:Reverse transcriptase zinc-binding domain-containing protein n=1 Tax=Daucus carota subsp. sativus TaxID=79200 RepID=A0AAF0W2U4_DAUCS|nr:PREDICTED: uncharacterized protein LOC108218536 [Daucus carota subsp. sativus]WOG82032.1 hypothetical protein DCAR_0101191 [Daucus carota subsp. sativus]
MTYLGHQINSSPRRRVFWGPLVKRVRLKLSLWKEQMLNKSGRTVLIKSTINSLPLYWMNLAKIPRGVIREIDLVRRRFFWKENASGTSQIKKMHSINWRVICQPKELGGLALHSIHDRNVLLLSKWLWKLKKDRTSLYSRVLVGKYGEELIDSIYSGTFNGRLNSLSDFIRDLAKIPGEFRDGTWDHANFKWQVQNGNTIRFWTDWWIGSESLSAKFPELFGISKFRYISVKEMSAKWNQADFDSY